MHRLSRGGVAALAKATGTKAIAKIPTTSPTGRDRFMVAPPS
jgi:hypothetical protein